MAGAQLKVLSAGAVKRGVALLTDEFARATGAAVTVEFAQVPELRGRVLAGETADVFVATPAALDDFAQQGKIIAESRGFVGRSRMGVVIHANAPLPGLGDTAAFRRAMLGATEVVHNEASSGLYAAKLLERLGLKDVPGTRIVVVRGGAAVMEHVAAHPGAVGLAQISEVMVLIDRGCAVRLAAPLPDEIQNVTSYDAAAAADSQSRNAARALADRLTSPEAKKIFAATGIN